MFEIKEYHKDFYVNGKFIGYHKLETYTGQCGYASKENFIAHRNLTVQKALGKYAVIKKGQHYTTQIIPLCGRLNGTWKEKINILSNTRQNFKS